MRKEFPQIKSNDLDCTQQIKFVAVCCCCILRTSIINVFLKVLIEVKASSLDFADFRVARGEWKRVRSFIYRFDPNEVPANAAVLGRSGSGIVVGVGTDVTRVKTGDKVWFFSPPWNQGSMANYVAADSRYVGRMPSNLDFESAATLPFVGLQAFQLIRDNLPGEGKSSVLIWGGWRPLERVAAQIAKRYCIILVQ